MSYFLLLKIKREIGILLEDAQFSGTFQRNTAGCNIGHSPIFKFDARIGNILTFGKDLYSYGLDRFNSRVY